MSILQAFILGAVQGLTEFLPISSSGHLVLIPYIFKWNYQGVAFDVALHAGTAVALLVYFWKDWLNIIKNAFKKSPPSNSPQGENKKKFPSAPVPFAGGGVGEGSDRYPNNFLWMIIVASIPAGIFGLLINNYVEKNFHFILLIALNLAVFGWLLWYADKRAKTDLTPSALTYKKAFIVGLFQSIALIPGVSRSGITIIGSRLIGFEREVAARFSFLIATPAIVGAFMLKLPDIMKEDTTLVFWVGVVAAAIFSLAAIKFLLVYLRKSDFSLFMWYRLILAAAIIGIFLINFWHP